MKIPSLFVTFAALYLAGGPATAVTIHFQDSYDGPWKWDEITMTERTVTTDDRTVTYCKGTARITGYSGSDTELVIPAKISWSGDHKVTGVVNPVSIHFEYEVDVVEIDGLQGSWVAVTIPNSVTNLGYRAFIGCSGLTSVTIPDSVTSIGASAFSGCSGLTSVTIPDSVTSIGDDAFASCSAMKSITILGNVTSDWIEYGGGGPFKGCQNLETITLGNNMTIIGNYMFYNLPIKTVVIGSGVTSIGASAFSGCSGLTSVTIPDSVTSIGDYAFRYCSSLTSVTIGNGVTSIGVDAFSFCSGLVHVYCQSDIATWCAIDFAANYSYSSPFPYASNPFLYASNLYIGGELVTSLVIPDGVKDIPAYAFYNCDCFQSVHIPDSVTNIGENAFASCDNITAVRTPQYLMTQGLSSVFPGSYQKLRRVCLGPDVTAIRDDEFHNFRALEQIEVEAGNGSFRVAADGCLYDIGQTTLVACPRNSTDFVIPDSVTKIHDYALDGCGALWAKWYGTLSVLAANGGGGGAAIDPRYALGGAVADRAIATVTVDGDCAIDSFVLTDGKVFDTVLRVINTSASPSTLTLPSGYAYERLKGTTPLTIPALSTNLLTITRTADRVFFVAREEMEPAQ